MYKRYVTISKLSCSLSVSQRLWHMQDTLIFHVCSLREKEAPAVAGFRLNTRLHQLLIIEHTEQTKKTNKEEWKMDVTRNQRKDALFHCVTAAKYRLSLFSGGQGQVQQIYQLI